MTGEELKQKLALLAEKHMQTEEYNTSSYEPYRGEALRLIFEYAMENNYRVEGYNLKKLASDPKIHWKEICDMIYDINDMPGLADKGFRDWMHYWFNDLCPEMEPSE